MVTGILNGSTNQPTKKQKQQRSSSEQDNGRLTTSRLLFAFQSQTFQPHITLPKPKALTAPLPNFDGKSEKFELFEDLFRNNTKNEPHLTEKQKTNCFHSLIRGNALQAYCSLDDTKIDHLENLEELIMAFERRFWRFSILRESQVRVGRSTF